MVFGDLFENDCVCAESIDNGGSFREPRSGGGHTGNQRRWGHSGNQWETGGMPGTSDERGMDIRGTSGERGSIEPKSLN